MSFPSGFDTSFLQNITTEQSKILVSVFTGLMNEKAVSLGCTQTHFITPNGLDASDETGEHVTTAKELAVIMSYCIQNEEFLAITQTKEHQFGSYSVSNANAGMTAKPLSQHCLPAAGRLQKPTSGRTAARC